MSSVVSWFLACEGEPAGGVTTSIPGCYLDGIPVPGFPVEIEDLHFIVFVRTSADAPHQGFTARIEVPGCEPLAVDADPALPGQITEGASFWMTRVVVKVPTFSMKVPGRIKVYATVGELDVYAGSLPVYKNLRMLADLLGPNMVHAISFFENVRAESSIFAQQMAPDLLGSLAAFLQGSGFSPQQVGKGLNVQVGSNLYRFFPNCSFSENAQVKFSNLPQGVEAIVTERTQVSITYRLEPPAQPRDIEITVDDA